MPKIEIINSFNREDLSIENQHYYENRGSITEPMFKTISISSFNTADFTEVGDYYRRNGRYEFQPPSDYTKGGNYEKWLTKFRNGQLSKDEINYFVREDDRIRNGMKVPGQLVDSKLQDVWITGRHYFYLNYCPIHKLNSAEFEESPELIIQKKILGRKKGKKTKDFPQFWDGDFYFWHAKDLSWELGLHFLGAKARRKGFSYKESADSAYTLLLEPDSITVLAAYLSKYLYEKGRGLYVMALDYLNFINLTTIWRKERVKSRSDGTGIKIGRKLKTGETVGFNSELYSISVHDNPDAVIGDDVTRLKVDEAGKFPNLEQFLGVTLSALEDGSILTGQASIYGTGGTKDANWEYFERLCENPSLIKAMVFENIWDEEALGSQSAYFFPHIQNLTGFVDKNGFTKLAEAKAFDIEDKAKHKLISEEDDHKLYVSQRANNFREAFSRNTSSVLPSILAHEQKQKLERNPSFKNGHKYGTYERTGEGLRFIFNDELPEKLRHPFVDVYPHKDSDDLEGCIVEYHPPYKENGRIPRGLYGLCIDPFGITNDGKDKMKKFSLGVCYVLEMPNTFTPTQGNKIVASYIGRPKDPDKFNENCLLLAERYGALQMVLFENNRGTLKDYFTNAEKEVYLMPTPDYIAEKEFSFTHTQKYGVTMTTSAIDISLISLSKWLQDDIGNGNRRIATIEDIGLLKEIEKFNDKQKPDRIRALQVGMFLLGQSKYNDIRRVTKTDSVKNFFNPDRYYMRNPNKRRSN